MSVWKPRERPAATRRSEVVPGTEASDVQGYLANKKLPPPGGGCERRDRGGGGAPRREDLVQVYLTDSVCKVVVCVCVCVCV